MPTGKHCCYGKAWYAHNLDCEVTFDQHQLTGIIIRVKFMLPVLFGDIKKMQQTITLHYILWLMMTHLVLTIY